jgi:hypothetical protein
MTLLQTIRSAFIAIGEPSDLQYYVTDRDDPDQDPVGNSDYFQAWCELVDAFNEAALDVATWKFEDNHQLRFRFLEETTSVDSAVEAMAIAGIVGNIISWTSTGTVSAVTDFYKGRLLYQTATSTAALVMRSYTSAGVNYLVVASVGALAAGVATLSKREYRFVNVDFAAPPVAMNGIPWDFGNGRPLDVIEIYDSVSSVPVEFSGKYDAKLGETPAQGTPTEAYKLSGGFRFDTWPDSVRSYLIRFFRGPRPISYIEDPDSAESELPPHFHQAIYLWLVWWGMRRKQESSDAYSAKRDLVDFLKRKRTEDNLQDTLQQGQLKLSVEG